MIEKQRKKFYLEKYKINYWCFHLLYLEGIFEKVGSIFYTLKDESFFDSFNQDIYLKNKTKESYRKRAISSRKTWQAKSNEELQEHSNKVSSCTRKAMTKEVKIKISKRTTLAMTEDTKIKMRQKKKALKDSGYYKTDSWFATVEIAQQKSNETKKKNGSYGKSQWEDRSYELLLTKFSKEDIERQYFDKQRYPFKCDFYIKSLNLFIECHYDWRHMPVLGPFDSSNKKHLEHLKWLQEKSDTHKNSNKNNYQNAIYQWTDLDVRKRQCAIDNKLNWKAFYSLEEFNEWLKKGILKKNS